VKKLKQTEMLFVLTKKYFSIEKTAEKMIEVLK